MTTSITIEALEFKKIKGKANESKKGSQQTDIVSTQKNIFDKSWEII